MSAFRARVYVALFMVPSTAAFAQGGLQSSDLLKLRSVSAVQLSPDATRVAYVVDNNDGDRRPYGQLWVMTLADGKTVRFGGDKDSSGNPEWSPDSQSIAYQGRVGDRRGLVVARPDGTGARLLAEVSGTNAPLPGAGRTIAWSPDGKRIAFTCASGPTNDLCVIDRSGSGFARLTTNISVVAGRPAWRPDGTGIAFVASSPNLAGISLLDLASGSVTPVTAGSQAAWSRDGFKLVFVGARLPGLFTTFVDGSFVTLLKGGAYGTPAWRP
jgi:Tol biopolymer transport system component